MKRVALAALFAFKTNRYHISYFSMIVLTTSTSAQTFSFIPRDTPTSMVLTDDQTNVPVTIAITSQTSGNYVNTLTATFALEEGHFYDLVLYKNTDIVYKDRIFCTDQNIVTFSVNNGEYTSNTTSNTFIVYE